MDYPFARGMKLNVTFEETHSQDLDVGIASD